MSNQTAGPAPVGTFWQRLGDSIKVSVARLGAAAGDIWKQLKPVVIATEQELAELAMTAVLGHVSKVMAGDEKLNSATADILLQLGSQGKVVGTKLAQAAVQAAFNELQLAKAASQK